MQDSEKTVYIRVKNVYIPCTQSTPPDTRSLFCHLLPQEDGCISTLLGSGVLTTSSVWVFHFNDQNSSYVGFLLKDTVQQKEYPLARLVLPLSWFPTGKVVTQQFPMHPVEQRINPVCITLDIHIATAGSTPFQAPSGHLLMSPRWQDIQVPSSGNSPRQEQISNPPMQPQPIRPQMQPQPNQPPMQPQPIQPPMQPQPRIPQESNSRPIQQPIQPQGPSPYSPNQYQNQPYQQNSAPKPPQQNPYGQQQFQSPQNGGQFFNQSNPNGFINPYGFQ